MGFDSIANLNQLINSEQKRNILVALKFHNIHCSEEKNRRYF